MFKNFHFAFGNDVEPIGSISIPEDELVWHETFLDGKVSQFTEFVIIQAGENGRVS